MKSHKYKKRIKNLHKICKLRKEKKQKLYQDIDALQPTKFKHNINVQYIYSSIYLIIFSILCWEFNKS